MTSVALPSFRLAFVLPRYTSELFGGAEMLAGALAGKLAEVGHAVEILTTCAVDHYTWKNELPAGLDEVRNLPVRRFPVDSRDLGIFIELERAVGERMNLTAEEQNLWLRNQVSSHAMEEYLEAHGESFDLIFPIPYLFGTSYFAYQACPQRVVPIPCLHDEPYAYLAFVKEMLEGSRGVMLNSNAEGTLAKRIAPGLAPSAVVGMGFEPANVGDVASLRSKYGLRHPFILYLGRREGGKNVPMLIEYFMRYKKRRRNDLSLVFVGKGEVTLPDRHDIVELDLDWNDRDTLYSAALAFCQPSRNESFSIVIMQAWLASSPVIVNSRCDVTREHCEESNGGLWFGNYAEFEEVVDLLVRNDKLRRSLAKNGLNYVRTRYSWEAVIDRFNSAIADWVGERAVG